MNPRGALISQAAVRELAASPGVTTLCARFDRLLAAHALCFDAAIVTNNNAVLADVPGLRVENWAEP